MEGHDQLSPILWCFFPICVMASFDFQPLSLAAAASLADGASLLPCYQPSGALRCGALCPHPPTPCLCAQRSPSCAETKRVIAAFERCLATSDMLSLSALRDSIEVRGRARARLALALALTPSAPPTPPSLTLPLRARSVASTPWMCSTTRTWWMSAPCCLASRRASCASC